MLRCSIHKRAEFLSRSTNHNNILSVNSLVTFEQLPLFSPASDMQYHVSILDRTFILIKERQNECRCGPPNVPKAVKVIGCQFRSEAHET